jgi:hypothetical protein
MDLVKELEKIEDLYYGEWEEDKDKLVSALTELHLEAGEDEDDFNRFLVQTADRFGGAYIPYLFWDKMAYFLDSPLDRTYVQKLIKAFTNSNFDEDEQMKMKPLLVPYFAREKTFEVSKVKARIIDKAHPDVKEYFYKLMNFVDKNKRATEMYCEKFDLLKDVHPDFNLLSLPITQLKDRLGA